MIGFVGLSHLGIVSSIAAASKGFEVVGFDSRKELCLDLSQGRLPISEPNLPQLFDKNKERLSFTNNPAHLSECDLIIFSIDISTDQENRSNVSDLQKLIQEVLPYTKNGVTLVILSQVHPGFTRHLAFEIQKLFPKHQLNLYYQVETLIFGQAVERAVSPERYIVGCADAQVVLPLLYEKLLKSGNCPILKMRYESAELAKISINLFLAASLSTTNTLAEICERIGADWSEIVPALQLDKRIGPHAYLKPGLGIAGGNIERDLVSVKKLAAEYGAEDCVPQAFLQQSYYRRDWALRVLHQRVLSSKKKPTIAIWGLAYKPNTNSIKNSPTLALLNSLKGISVRLYDPQTRLGEGYSEVIQVSSALKACEGSDALIMMTAWDEFVSISPTAVKEILKETTVIDPWGIWKEKNLSGFDYSTLGR